MKTCEYCGKENKRYRGIYCSKDCSRAAAKANMERRSPIPGRIWKIPVENYVHNKDEL